MIKKAAVIGLGNISVRHRQNLKILNPKMQVIAMSASGRFPNENIPNGDLIVESLDNIVSSRPDLAIVASPAPYHMRHAMPLVNSGIPVLIEKPVTMEIEEVDALIEASRSRNTSVSVGYCLRFMPSALVIKKLLREKCIGQILNISIEAGQFLPDWRKTKNYEKSVSANKFLGGGALLELSHEFDYARWIFGELSPKAAILRSSDILGLEVEDIVDVIALNEEGAVVSIHLDFVQRNAHRRCRIIGTEGTLEWNLLRNIIKLSDKQGERVVYDAQHWDRNKMYLDMLKNFIYFDKEDEEQRVSLEDAKLTLSLIKNIRTLAEQQQEKKC